MKWEVFSALYLTHRPADVAQNVTLGCGIISPNARRYVQVIVYQLNEVEAAPLPILHFSLGIWISKVTVDKYLETHILWDDSKFTLQRAEIGGKLLTHEELPYGALHGVLNCWT